MRSRCILLKTDRFLFASAHLAQGQCSSGHLAAQSPLLKARACSRVSIMLRKCSRVTIQQANSIPANSLVRRDSRRRNLLDFGHANQCFVTIVYPGIAQSTNSASIALRFAKLASAAALLRRSKILAEARTANSSHEIVLVKRSTGAIVVWLSIATLIAATDVARAGPFRDFFRTIRTAIAHPKETPRPHRSRHKHHETPPSDASSSPASASPVPSSSAQREVRWAKGASDASQQQTELPYGTPVAGKPGLVTSPFAPDKGYVDVTGFAPRTAVEDPYTGKIFQTP
jgi:hypothetical protein